MRLSLQITNRIDEISRLEGLVGELARKRSLPGGFIKEINLVLEEIVSNTILYGYPDDEEDPRTIDIELTLEEEVLRIHLVDDARRFNPLEALPNQENRAGKLRDMELGGLGLGLVRHFSDEIDYAYMQNRNHLWIVKHLRF